MIRVRSTATWVLARRAAGLLNTAIRGHGLRILLYHHFPSQHMKSLHEQCALLSSRYRPMALSDAIARLQNGEPLPRNAIAVTVDDGYADYAESGVECFLKFEIPSTVFVCERLIEGHWLWYDRVEYAFACTRRGKLSISDGPWGPSRSYAAGSNNEKQASLRRALAEAKRMPSSVVDAFVDAIELAAEIGPSAAPVDPWQGMSWETLRTIASHELVSVGAHTANHPILSRLEDPFALRDEIAGCRERISRKLGSDVDFFAYPNGQPEDLSPEVVSLVREAGYSAAFTTTQGVNRRRHDPILLPRIAFRPDHPVAMLDDALACAR